MKRLYYFFDLEYENVYKLPNLPFRLLLVSVGYVGFHWHSEAEILFVLDGGVRVRTSRGLTSLSAGDVMVIRPNELHGLVEQTRNIILVVQPDGDLFHEDFHSPGSAEYPLPPNSRLPESVMDALRFDLAAMARETWDREKGFEAMALAALHHFIGVLDRNVAVRGDGGGEGADKNDQARIKKVLDFLHSQYARRISLEDVADCINVSPSYASHLVKKGTGRSMQENLGFIRTGKAVDLLMRTDMKLIEISMAVGFSDPKYFNLYFRKLFGSTPREMKKNPDWREAILKHFRDEGLAPSYGRPFVERYLIRG